MSALRHIDPQVAASDPARSVFVTANAGSGKTSTLVKRVARLLLGGARPETILCVTYTKAAAAEMQRRLFDELGGWAVMDDARLAGKLADLDERQDDLSNARALFARALETPGGLKIQTIHAFCEKLLRRFPLEAGVSPGFRVLEDAAAREISAKARDDVAHLALLNEDGPIGAAYAHFSVQLDWRSFNAMFATFEARRAAIAAYIETCEDGYVGDVWRRLCGFAEPMTVAALEAAALAGVDWPAWRRAAEALALGTPASDQKMGAAMRATGEDAGFEAVWGLFCTQAGTPRSRLATNAVDPAARAWLGAEQERLLAAAERIKAARIAADTVHALVLAGTYAQLYEGAKSAAGGLDFGDLIARTHELLTVRADAAWVLYKLDGGIEHVLLDEAQDTAPDQWDILHALTEEFFAGATSRPSDGRTLFAVGDEKQSIYSFQGAEPERFLREAGAYRALIEGAGRGFDDVPLLESWRSTPEVLGFVDAVFADGDARAGLTPGAAPDADPITHIARREAGHGAVDFWPLEESEPDVEADPWDPVDKEPSESANKKLARRIARAVRAMVARREAVFDRETRAWRPARYGDVLILVRRRKALFHEIIRALKREGVAVGGADRLTLSDHVVFQDLMALGRFARFPSDDLTLAALLRSPFCDVDEEGLFDLAQGRKGALWPTLVRRADERAEWREAAGFLGWAVETATRPPFDFYARVLSRLDLAGRSMRARMLTRLGREAEDALDAFLGEALAAEQRGVRDLERFLAQMTASEIEVKREQEDRPGPAGGEVRVMTAHGSKGLEAPIVILPDTTTRAGSQGGPLLDAEGGYLWAPRKADDCPASAAARALRDQAGANESLRLLYVALTRARDRLIVCGVATREASYTGSWHEVASRALAREEIVAKTHIVADGEAQITRYGFDPLTVEASAGARSAPSAPPDWALRFAPPEPVAQRYASPSTLAESERGPAPSPLAERQGLGRYRRGLIIHRLLQLLPDLPAAGRRAAAASLLAREIDLTDPQRDEMATAALAVLEDARFAAVFGPGSRAEAAVAGAAAGLPAGLAISGRVDRLLVEPERVLVVDFKTNRPAPDRIEDADPAYLTQMAVYAAVLADVFPGRRIEAALVWTDGPKLMPVSENIVAETLARLRAER
jgi:ATP-dependent helicase/nuclease subunit A